MQDLLNSIEKFDHSYMMSDSYKVYDKWSRIEYSLTQEIKALPIKDLKKLYDSMSKEAREMFTWKFIYEKLDEAGAFAPSETTKTKTLRSVMKTAWAILRNGLCKNISEALKLAWSKIKLATALKDGVVYFSFKKKDGSVREAIGTLREGNFDYKHKGTSTIKVSDLVKFWDLEKKGFRSFRINNLLTIK